MNRSKLLVPPLFIFFVWLLVATEYNRIPWTFQENIFFYKLIILGERLLLALRSLLYPESKSSKEFCKERKRKGRETRKTHNRVVLLHRYLKDTMGVRQNALQGLRSLQQVNYH